MFGGENSEEYQAVYDAIHKCGKDNDTKEECEKTAVYKWLESTTRTSLTVELVNKLHDMGFSIKKT